MNIDNSEIQLPEYLVIDLREELRGLRGLRLLRTPPLEDHELNSLVVDIMNALTNMPDIEYQICDVAYGIELKYFGQPQFGPQEKMIIQNTIINTAQQIHLSMRNLGLYIGPILPYECLSARLMSEVVLQKLHKPAFRFAT